MKSLVLYHAHCTDGFGAAFAAWLVYKDDAEYIPLNYGQIKTVSDIANLPERPIDTYDNVYIFDFSLPKEIMEWVFKASKKVVWLDHHKTAFEMWTGEYAPGDHYAETSCCHKINLNDNKSGAMLAWEYFSPTESAPAMIAHIDDRDRWQFKLHGTKEFHAYMASIKPWTFERWGEIYMADSLIDIYREGAAILRAHQQDVKTIVDVGVHNASIEIVVPANGPEPSQLPNAADGYTRWFDGKSANCPPHFASDVGHELANLSGTYGLCWYVGRDGKVKCSLRSNGEYDVSAIAKSFGGGGHRNAAGFEIDITTLLGWLK